jgi:hypothetical protein
MVFEHVEGAFDVRVLEWFVRTTGKLLIRQRLDGQVSRPHRNDAVQLATPTEVENGAAAVAQD